MTEAQAKLLNWFRDHAATLSALGEASRAARVIEKALAFADRNLGEDDEGYVADFFAVLSAAARFKLDHGEAGKAIEIYEKALELTQRPKVNLETAAIAEAQQHLGMALDRMERETEAAAHFEQALAAMESVDPPPYESIANLANNLGMIYRNQGDYPGAEARYRQALEIFNALGDGHQLDSAVVCNNLGTLYWAWRQPELARDYHLQAIKLRREQLPDSHPDIGQSACNLAAVYHDLGDFDKANFNYERALKILRRNLREDPGSYEIVANNYADLLEAYGHAAKGRKLRAQTEKRVSKFRGKQRGD